MAAMGKSFSIIDWQSDPRVDLVLLRFERERVGKAVGPLSVSALSDQEPAVCFRAEELTCSRRRSEQGVLEGDRVIDANLLARTVWPTEESHKLEALAAKLGLDTDWPDAAARVRTAASVFAALLKGLAELPIPVLAEMSRLLKSTGNPLFDLVEAASKRALRKGFGARQRRIEDLFSGPGAFTQWSRRTPPRAKPALLDVEATCSRFSPEGIIARNFAVYEHRPEQLRMVREVCEAFNDSLMLLVEAGTGTGKSLAYLVPAIIWAVKNNEPVVVSTNTKNLQMQLMRKDLPFLEKALGGSFKYAPIKGRANYLCIRKLLMLLRGADQELTDEDRLELLPILSWLPKAVTGDVAENSGFRPGMASGLWGLISTRIDECVGPRCRWWRQCFVRKARAIAAQSDIIVANHATVFWEVEDQNVALPPYRCIVFDEAHNLEDVATSCFGIEVTPWQVPRILNRLFRGPRHGAGLGLFANLRFQLSRVSRAASSDAATRMSQMIADCVGTLPAIRSAGDSLFGAAENVFRSTRWSGGRIRYDADHRPEEWGSVTEAIATLVEALEKFAESLDTLRKLSATMTEGKENEEPFRSQAEVAADIGVQATLLRAIIESLNTVSRAEDERYVYWLGQEPKRGATSLCAAPIDIGDMMDEKFYSRVRTAVFTSATLTADRRFDFMRDRLGMRGPPAERLREVDLGTSFDFPRQVLLAVPLFLPEPRAAGASFVRSFCELAVNTLKATRGRGLVLFTSHAMLREAYTRIEPALARARIRVFCQNVDGERSRLMSLFAKDTSSVLLGTQSFWEGMDVPGESLSCLILAKLPFRPHTDPIVSARCEYIERDGGNPFSDYMVPDAVIRLKQGFGRLIRTRHDRGVVLICDPRMMTKSYGRAFRDSLPAPARGFSKHEELVASLQGFLGAR